MFVIVVHQKSSAYLVSISTIDHTYRVSDLPWSGDAPIPTHSVQCDKLSDAIIILNIMKLKLNAVRMTIGEVT